MGNGTTWMRRMVLVFATAALAGCGAEPGSGDDFFLSDDDADGDSVSVDGAAQAPGVRVPSSLGLDRRGVFYLTFDDGPSTSYTRPILRVLAAHHAPATFFVTGARISGAEPILREELAAGHIVASHQWSHVIASSTQFESWIPRQRDLIDTTLGGRQPRLFRYPYGAGSTTKENRLRAFGYSDGGIGWDVDTLDWCYGGGGGTCARATAAYRSDFVGWVVSEARRMGGGVMLFHDIQRITANNLDAILTRMEAAGYRFGQLPTTGR